MLFETDGVLGVSRETKRAGATTDLYLIRNGFTNQPSYTLVPVSMYILHDLFLERIIPNRVQAPHHIVCKEDL